MGNVNFSDLRLMLRKCLNLGFNNRLPNGEEKQYGGRLRIQISPQIFGKDAILSRPYLLGPGELVDRENRREKSRDTVFKKARGEGLGIERVPWHVCRFILSG